MMDKEIIKVLNTATNIDGLQICCIDYENDPETKTFLSIKSDVVDLINRQQAKIEALVEDTLCLRDTLEENESLRAEIEGLTINMNAFGLGMKREKERADTARAEAIKEFAERLKQKVLVSPYDVNLFSPYTDNLINNLVKEMVGEE